MYLIACECLTIYGEKNNLQNDEEICWTLFQILVDYAQLGMAEIIQ